MCGRTGCGKKHHRRPRCVASVHLVRWWFVAFVLCVVTTHSRCFFSLSFLVWASSVEKVVTSCCARESTWESQWHGTAHTITASEVMVSVADQARVWLACVRLGSTVECDGPHASHRVEVLCGDGVNAVRQSCVGVCAWQCGLLVELTVALVWTCCMFDECFFAEQCERWWYEHLLARTPAVCDNGRCMHCLIE